MTEQEAQHKFGEYITKYFFIEDAAFPQTVETSEKIFHTKGLTKREYFAAMAMQGLLVNHNHIGVAFEAVRYADNLIKALNESQF